jgi:hypothetical protein
METKNKNLKINKGGNEMKNKKEIIRNEKGKAEFEKSKKVEELRKQGKTTDMFKLMFGQK